MKLELIHVGITVKDLDKTRSFYEKLGFEAAQPFETTWEGYWKEKNFFYKLPEGVNGKILFMTSPNGNRLEFFCYDNTEEAIPGPFSRVSIHHIALQTDDIQAVASLLKEEGIQPEIGPVQGKTQAFLFFRDPDGHLLEVGQPYAK